MIDVLTNLLVVIISQYIYQIITLHTLNLHNVICQLYPNKAGGETVIEIFFFKLVYLYIVCLSYR